MESKKINQLATELAPELSDLTIIGDPTTGISKKITLSQMASLFTGTVEEYPNLASFPLVGTADTIYIALDTNIIYRWNTGTSAYVELSPNIVTSLVFSDANGFDGTISLVGSTATLTITTALTQGSVPFIGASGALSQDNANLFFDDTNNRLGINTNTPTTALDVFGSGIIGRLNGTSTNNAFLGFASAGSNKWSIGNVQSDHRFRIYNEATTSELVSVLQTGEFGIGIANPLTKLHIFGGASALIANLDANTSVAKSISFRSGNSSRFNIEVSGTESGSNAGMDFYLRAYTDAGALLSTPLTISRSTGAVTLSSSLSATGATFTSTQTNLVLNTTTNTSFTKLSFQENGSEKATITYPNSTFGAPTRREKLEISNLGGINFITQNAPLSPNVSITSDGYVGIGIGTPLAPLHINYALGTSNAALRLTNGSVANASNITKIALFTVNTFGGAEESAAIFAINPNAGTNNGGHLVFGTSAYSTASTPTERMRLNNLGYLGINSTDPKGFIHVGGALQNSSDAAAIILKQSSTTAATGIYLERSGEQKGYYMYLGGAADSLTFQRNNAGTKGDVMSLTRDGLVGIGITNPSNKLDVRNSGDFDIKIRSEAAGGTVGILLETANTFSGTSQAFIKCIGSAGGGQSELVFGTAGTSGATTATERIRITSGGTRIFNNEGGGTTNTFNITPYSSGNALSNKVSTTAGWDHFYFQNPNGNVGSISTNGSNTTYSTSSDYRLKEDLKDFDGLDILSKIKFYDFAWKCDNTRTIGVIAHELQSIVPYAVNGEKDAVDAEGNIKSQGVDYSKLVAIQGKAIQQLQAQIEELKALINK